MKIFIKYTLVAMIFSLLLTGCAQKKESVPKTYGKVELKTEMGLAAKEVNSVLGECK